MESCETCKFRRYDECRKNPPVRLPRKFDEKATVHSRIRDEALIWGWPKIGLRDWCGEYRLTADA